MANPPNPAAGRVTPCRWCIGLVVRDHDGRPIHTDLSYACKDRFGVVTGNYAEPPPGPQPFRSAR